MKQTRWYCDLKESKEKRTRKNQRKLPKRGENGLKIYNLLGYPETELIKEREDFLEETTHYRKSWYLLSKTHKGGGFRTSIVTKSKHVG